MIKRTLLLAAALSTANLAITSAWGQTVFRCGSRYSQSPCPGAVAIDIDDSRTPEQKAQTDAAAAQAAATADRMERDRLAREKAQAGRPAATSTRPAKAPKAAASKPRKSSSGKTSKAKPEYFVAGAPAEPGKTLRKPTSKTVQP